MALACSAQSASQCFALDCIDGLPVKALSKPIIRAAAPLGNPTFSAIRQLSARYAPLVAYSGEDDR